MARSRPRKVTANELVARERRTRQIAHHLGFVGRVEYRHVYSQTGGAQYGLASEAEDDLLIVYAEAFERDADPEDFSLEAIIAHERGHQLLARHTRLRRNLPAEVSEVTEEIVASLIGSLLVQGVEDQQALVLKALFDAIQNGLEPDHARVLVTDLRGLLENIL